MSTITPTATTTAIRHRLGIDAEPAEVFARLATEDGLRRWWTQDVRGRSAVGDQLSFHFGAPDRYCVMEVCELTPDERVVWRCVDGPQEWIDTRFLFEMRPADDSGDAKRQDLETVLLFTNDGWREPVEFMHHCTTKWASYLIGLKQDLEVDGGRPFPNDVKLSGWD